MIELFTDFQEAFFIAIGNPLAWLLALSVAMGFVLALFVGLLGFVRRIW